MTTTDLERPSARTPVSAESAGLGTANTSNAHVLRFIQEAVDLCKPDGVVWCDGSKGEKDRLLAQGVDEGVFIKLNQQRLPGCYYHRSNANDVARSEHLTFICAPSQDTAGPTNNWMESRAAYAKMRGLFDGCMRGRTMYVIPFVMGPIGSPLAKVGVQVTDSVYVVVNMGIMTRMGEVAWKQLGDDDEFTRCMHSIGDVNPDRRYICHFPFDNAIWSFGSGYGGNALLGKKCLALRIASFLGRQQEWMAEHMLLMGAESPDGEKSYVAAAFPSACGKTNFAMLIPPPKYDRWKITTVGDDIAWMWVDEKGKLRAINPESGYFGVVPGTNSRSNPNALRCMEKETIYTNVALVPLEDGTYDVWWEGKDGEPPAKAIDWQGNEWSPNCKSVAAHPNSRFTAPATNNPVLDPAWNDPAGVPVTAIIFGGRRSRSIPLVFQAFNWLHGVYVGATIGSETTAAASGQTGVVRRDPMAMLPFIGYNIRDYLVHWFRMRKKMSDCPRIFMVNWFRKNDQGKFVWPGFGENMRVLKWIIDRAHGRAYAKETLLGWMPRPEDIDLEGLNISVSDFEKIQSADPEEFKSEILSQEELFLKLAGDLPKEMVFQREMLIARL
ncbi:MAG TPA: phosphoenolpyruvate carboxykinase (GTP) [Tepidisphaeraceae bacterium]|nr:phosphoenolpyruvate carboxykinase (GTP) [Tepidisphaeraceae bacterium]